MKNTSYLENNELQFIFFIIELDSEDRLGWSKRGDLPKSTEPPLPTHLPFQGQRLPTVWANINKIY